MSASNNWSDHRFKNSNLNCAVVRYRSDEAISRREKKAIPRGQQRSCENIVCSNYPAVIFTGVVRNVIADVASYAKPVIMLVRKLLHERLRLR